MKLVLLIPFCACFILLPSFPQVNGLKHYVTDFKGAKEETDQFGFYNSWGKRLAEKFLTALCCNTPDLTKE